MIRPFSDDDADACRRIIKDCVQKTVDYEERIKAVLLEKFTAEGYLESNARQYPLFVYERDGVILGMGGLKGNEIKRMYVAPEHQGEGIGKEIFRFLEKFAKEQAVEEVVLYSFPNAVGFYLKEGYSIVREHHYESPEKGIRIPTTEMRKRI